VRIVVGVVVALDVVTWNVVVFGTTTLGGAVVTLRPLVGELAGTTPGAVLAVAVAVSVAVEKVVDMGG
jgi:hypothetical protein